MTPAEAFRRLAGVLSLVPTGHELHPTNTVELRHDWRPVLCGDCGPGCNSRDRCPYCGGHAEPIETHMARRLRARALRRNKLRRASGTSAGP